MGPATVKVAEEKTKEETPVQSAKVEINKTGRISYHIE